MFVMPYSICKSKMGPTLTYMVSGIDGHLVPYGGFVSPSEQTLYKISTQSFMGGFYLAIAQFTAIYLV